MPNALRVALLFSLSFGFVSPAWAGSGSEFTLPRPGVKNRSGLRLTVDTRWVDGAGYRGVRCRVFNSNGTPAAADRSIRVEIRPHGWRYGGSGERTVAYIEFPQGKLYGEAWVPIRQEMIWGSIRLATFEDGEPLKDLSDGLSMAINNHYTEWTESFPCVLFIDEDMPPLSSSQNLMPLGTTTDKNSLPDFRVMAGRFPDNAYYGLPQNSRNKIAPISDLTIRDRIKRLRKHDIRCSQDLPKQWILYSCFDVIVISLEDAREFASQHPDKWSAVLRHVATGATLCIYGAGREFEYLSELEELCRLSDAAPGEEEVETASRWQVSENMRAKQIFGLNVNGNLRSVRQQERQQMGLGEINAEFKTLRELKGKVIERPFDVRWREIQLGKLIAIGADNPFPGDAASWNHVFNIMGHNRWQWRGRHGISLTQPNDEFWNMMIPGVGMAPVTSFIVLITLFVIILGPVNYITLNRWKRLYLLLVTVPLGAAIISFMLFGYAVINDGLGVRVRSRSFTQLDQRNRQVVSWARQTYYAGLAPSGGLRFPASTEVYPIQETPRVRNYSSNNRLQTTWEDLQYMQGYFSSRTTSQFMTINSAYTNHQLQISENDTSVKVKNLLGSDASWVLVCDSQGRLFSGTDIARDQSVDLTPTTVESEQKRLRAAMLSTHPAFPEGYDPKLHRHSFGRRNYYYYRYTNYESSVAKPSLATSLLERKIKEATALTNKPLKKRTYLALTSWAPDTPLGVYRVENEEASFHVVLGKW